MWWENLDDVELILLVLAVFYLSDCVYWSTSHCFRFMLCRDGFEEQIAEPQLFEKNQSFLTLGNLLPGGEECLCQSWPISLSPLGIAACPPFDVQSAPSIASTAIHIPWRTVKQVTVEGTELYINGVLFATTCSYNYGKFLQKTIERLASASKTERIQNIKLVVDKSTNTEALKRTVEQYRAETQHLPALSKSLFLVVFALFPSVHMFGFFWLPLTPLLIQLLIGTSTALILAITLLYSRAGTRLAEYQHEQKECLPHCLTMMLPTNAMRSTYQLSRNLCTQFHPLAISATAKDMVSFKRIARRLLLAARNSPHTMQNSESHETVHWFRQQITANIEELLRHQNIDTEQLLAPPPQYYDALSYCVRCDGQYTFDQGSCPECQHDVIKFPA